MTKHVHFAPTNILYSPIPPTPSPLSSSSSLPSETSDVSTPPPVHYTQSRYPHSPYPLSSEIKPETFLTNMQIHYILAFSPYSKPLVDYDISFHPSSVEEQFPPDSLSEPATNPSLPSLLITCPHFQWQIQVLPSSPQPGSFVTVSDVLNTLYTALRLAVHPMEYGSLPSGEATRDVDAAYYRRCGRISEPRARQIEENKGVKRVDFLAGKTRFLGLAWTMKGPDIWELNVS
ncbi:hypothetical protein BD779DRAFT_1612904 [Infundibulicybe gibba]|nr:hypothetical protein BD779DRAFT_1612904 [Infundibulicybe gibba]